jgi:hypothetical protein
VAVLRAHRKRQAEERLAEERLAFGPGYERAALRFSDPVFRNEDGTHVHLALYSWRWRRLRRRRGWAR